ncbi:aspartate dehydrogenase [Wohlfahrtiimonas populi]|uniref:aspartate dehydrogenase n=1 Tax=Wohlfahrtiimonas populi TaxID=1940240 RepID=UPI00098D6BA6|nr:aspartate dehydrogenase [Wohlfahrtiimonas populi]
MKKIMVIGYGAMAQYVLANLPSDISLGYLLVKPEKVEQTQSIVGDLVQVIGSVAELQGQPDIVVEMAGQSGLKQHLLDLLALGLDVGVISVGAFADREFEAKVKQTALDYQCKVHVLSGAVAGMDGLVAAKLAGLDQVIYQGRKPPQGWQGSYAESLIDLNDIEEATTFFKGTAREAATLFPANSNVAATIALAGIGMDATMVELIADPFSEYNQHKIRAYGAFGEMDIAMQGFPLPDNPKTSMLAALSVLKYCHQLTAEILI